MRDSDPETRRRAGLQKKKHFRPFVPRFGLKIRKGWGGGGCQASPLDPALITCNQTFFRGLIAQKLPQK